MNDQNKTPRKFEESAKPVTGSSAARPSAWKKLLAKRWVFPAAYMAAAAIIVTILWLNSGARDTKEDPTQAAPEVASEVDGEAGSASASPDAAEGEPDAEPVAATGETMRWPVEDETAMVVVKPFYDASAPEQERQAAMVQSDNTFTPHMAVDWARKDQQPFEVLAALSGKVTVAESHPLNGNVVEIEHPGGLVTVYQSLSELKVKVGDQVDQGDVIAMAGQSEAAKDEGVHLHFEVRNNGQSVNPNTMIES